jgi:hypothetical protein
VIILLGLVTLLPLGSLMFIAGLLCKGGWVQYALVAGGLALASVPLGGLLYATTACEDQDCAFYSSR